MIKLNSSSLKHSLGLIFCLAIVLGNIFYSFPIMGHDYSLVVTWANDYHYAWNKFGVFNIQFSPQRCLGIPVWSNPIGVNFSIFHILSIFFEDYITIILMNGLYISFGFYSALTFLKFFNLNETWRRYLAIGWCLQGVVLMRSLEGHLSYLGILLWPLLFALILKKYERKVSFFFSLILTSFLFAHDFYSGAPPLFVMFPLACITSYLLLTYLGLSTISFISFTKRLSIICFLASLIILPKVLAITSFVKNYQREVSFINIGLIKGMTYSFLSQLFPPVVDYRLVTGWWYGDWESTNYIFPFLLLFVFIHSILKFKTEKKVLISFLSLFAISTFISSGIYSELVKTLPFVKSFHVNPRWVIFLNLGYLVIIARYLEKLNLKTIWTYPLIIVCGLIPFLVRDVRSLDLKYEFRSQLNRKNNTFSGCYEPVFGYRLELFPFDKVKEGKYLDPRCYLTKDKCKDFILPDSEIKNLETYQLKPSP